MTPGPLNYVRASLISVYIAYILTPPAPFSLGLSPFPLQRTMSPGPSYVDVLIVGAGPAGLMCANALARAGVNVRIIDKRCAPFDRLNTRN
jgi:NADPH-dependent 2,4-dienoyl-CoA reductase/sulfur reductase-like enzyme